MIQVSSRAVNAYLSAFGSSFVVTALLAGMPINALAEEACPSPAVVAEVSAISPYASESEYAASTRSVRNFVNLIVASADQDASAFSKQCALANMARWADAGALLQKPTNFEGARQRIRYAFALNIAAVKLGIDRHNNETVVSWLRLMTEAVTNDFKRHRQLRGSADNLYVWSGAAAASFLLHTNNASLQNYMQRVWDDALIAIGPSGSVRLEEQRGSRSIPYHTYYLSALLWLKEFRVKLGEIYTEENSIHLRRLSAFIQREICFSAGDSQTDRAVRHPRTIRVEALQVLDNDLWRSLRQCGLRETGHGSAILGGNYNATKQLRAGALRAD